MQGPRAKPASASTTSEATQAAALAQGVQPSVAAAANAALSSAGVAPALTQARGALHALHRRLEDLPALLREFEAVAGKTKLLGFNAAILAAQAGSEGRSFAVVAEQMKALNQRAELTTQKLHTLVEALRRTAQQADRAVDAAKERAEASYPARSHTSAAFNAWVEATRLTVPDGASVADATGDATATPATMTPDGASNSAAVAVAPHTGAAVHVDAEPNA